MSKISSYQKVKQENARLKQDIYTILREKDPIKKFSVTTRWNIMFQTEDVIWAGTPTKIIT